MARRKEFAAAIEADEPIEFVLAGQTFNCLTKLPAAVFLRMVQTSGDSVDHNRIIELMEGILVEEDIPRFKMLLADKKNITQIETLYEIFAWVLTEITGTPLVQAQPTSDGQQENGTSSTDTGSHKESTFSNSTPAS